jgi:hypothetical protein
VGVKVIEPSPACTTSLKVRRIGAEAGRPVVPAAGILVRRVGAVDSSVVTVVVVVLVVVVLVTVVVSGVVVVTTTVTNAVTSNVKVLLSMFPDVSPREFGDRTTPYFRPEMSMISGVISRTWREIEIVIGTSLSVLSKNPPARLSIP